MRALARFVLRDQLSAIVVVALAGVLSMFVPLFLLFMYISGGAMGLVVLTQPLSASIRVLLGSIVVAGILMSVLGGSMVPALVYALIFWLPVVLLSYVLRRSESQGLVVSAAGVLAVLYIVVSRALVTDISGWWLTRLQAVREQTGLTFDDEALTHIASIMNGFLAASVCIVSLVLAVLLARWMHAAVMNPGGFRREFYALRLPRWLAGPALLTVLVTGTAVVPSGSILTDLSFVVLFMYLFQGLALVHWAVTRLRISQGWLFLNYALMLLVFAPMLMLLATLGLVDSWADFRARVASAGPGS